MTLGSKLRDYLGERQQKDVAMTWHEQWERKMADGQERASEKVVPSRDTVESRLSDRARAVAARRPGGPRALRVNDELHLINPPAGDTESEHAHIHVHSVTAPVPALSRLRDEVAEWTAEDWLADPFLEHTLDRLAPVGQDRSVLRHARATLALSGTITSRPAQIRRDWREILRALMQGNPPAAHLRVHKIEDEREETDEESDEETLGPKRFLARVPRSAKLSPPAARMARIPGHGDFLIGRDDKLVLVTSLGLTPVSSRQTDFYNHRTDTYEHGWERQASSLKAFLCLHAKRVGDIDLWLDLLDASPSTDGDHRKMPRRRWQEKLTGIGSEHVAEESFDIPSGLWSQADLQLAFAWWAIQSALERAPDRALHDGTGMLMLGGQGVFAEIRTYDCPAARSMPVRAALELPVSVEDRWKGPSYERERVAHLSFGPLLTPVVIERATSTSQSKAEIDRYHQVPISGDITTEAGHALPREIHLIGQSHSASIKFRASPLFTSAANARMSLLHASAIAAGHAAAVAGAIDDDDDD